MNVRTKRVERRYGLLLDGEILTATVTDRGRVVNTETIVGSSPAGVLQSWLSKVRPRGPVTVAVVSRAEQAAAVALAPGVPEALVRRHVESRIKAMSSPDAEPIAVAAMVTGTATDEAVAHVAAVPAEVMEDLWRSRGVNVRYTLPAMTYTREGVHLVVATTSAELLLISRLADGSTILEDALVLASGGLPLDSDEATRRAHAESTAEEVERAIDAWRRRGHDLGADVIHVTGTSVSVEELFEALELRGYLPQVDLVAERLSASDFDAVVASDPSALLRTALAAAAALCEPGPLGFLVPPRSSSAALERRSPLPLLRPIRSVLHRSEPLLDGPASRRLGLSALVIVAAGGVLAATAIDLPAHLGSHAVTAAARAQSAAESERASYGNEIELFAFNHSLATAARDVDGPRWDQVVPAIVASVPAGVSILTMDLTDQGAAIAVTVSASATDDGLVPQWLAALRTLGVQASTSGVTVDAAGTATFSTTFDVPRNFR